MAAFRFCPWCGEAIAAEGARFCAACGRELPIAKSHPVHDAVRSENLLEEIRNLIADSYAGRTDENETPGQLLNLASQLTDTQWMDLRAFASMLELQGWNLDHTEYLLHDLRAAAELTDSIPLKMRLLGLGSCSPAPTPDRIGFWWPQVSLWYEELELAEKRWLYSEDDARHLSDYGRSAAANSNDVFGIQVPEDPLEHLWIPLPDRGRLLSSMTPIVLLLREPEVADRTHEAILRHDLLLNPRLVHLFCDDANTIHYYWLDIHPWECMIETWKETSRGLGMYWEPGDNDSLLTEHLIRATTWSNYADPGEAQIMRVDESTFMELRAFLLNQ